MPSEPRTAFPVRHPGTGRDDDRKTEVVPGSLISAQVMRVIVPGKNAYLAFFFFSCFAAFFSFMVLAGFFLSLFFESRLLLMSLPPSWLRPLPCTLQCLARELPAQDYAYPERRSIGPETRGVIPRQAPARDGAIGGPVDFPTAIKLTA
jgi:hypothetical protein